MKNIIGRRHITPPHHYHHQTFHLYCSSSLIVCADIFNFKPLLWPYNLDPRSWCLCHNSCHMHFSEVFPDVQELMNFLLDWFQTSMPHTYIAFIFKSYFETMKRYWRIFQRAMNFMTPQKNKWSRKAQQWIWIFPSPLKKVYKCTIHMCTRGQVGSVISVAHPSNCRAKDDFSTSAPQESDVRSIPGSMEADWAGSKMNERKKRTTNTETGRKSLKWQ